MNSVLFQTFPVFSTNPTLFTYSKFGSKKIKSLFTVFQIRVDGRQAATNVDVVENKSDEHSSNSCKGFTWLELRHCGSRVYVWTNTICI